MSFKKSNRTKKRSSVSKSNPLSGSSEDIINELLNSEFPDDTNDGDDNDNTKLDQSFVLKQLKAQAKKGNTRALELLGKHLEIFEKGSKNSELIDIYAFEGDLETNILKFLDIIDDKYEDELKGSLDELLAGNSDMYRDEKDKEADRLKLQLAERIKAEKENPIEDLSDFDIPAPSQRSDRIKPLHFMDQKIEEDNNIVDISGLGKVL